MHLHRTTSLFLTLPLLACLAACGSPRRHGSKPAPMTDAGHDGEVGDAGNDVQPPVHDAGAVRDAGRGDTSEADSGSDASMVSAHDAGEDAGQVSIPGDPDWMSGHYGIGVHYLHRKLAETKNGGSDAWNAAVDSFDVARFADTVRDTGASWTLFTIGQNERYYASPCPVLDTYSGIAPGAGCSKRDLVLEVSKALTARGIRMIAYLPSNAPKNEPQIANALGLTATDANQNWHVDEAFVKKWAGVIQDWAVRLGPHVSAWWLDGYYGSNGFRNGFAQHYAAAVTAGNPDAIIALNCGAHKRCDDAEGYTSGEDLGTKWSNTCKDKLLDGEPCHVFADLGTGWGGGDVPYGTDEQLVNYVNSFLDVGAALTLNVPINGAGVIDPDFTAAFVRLRDQLHARK